jgi:hypothetical protein
MKEPTPTDRYYEGMTPSEYLEERGWRPREFRYDAIDQFTSGWQEMNFLDPVYGHWETLPQAMRLQLEREVERMGGFEPFMDLIDEHGANVEELEF